jgi:hypothetical protein
MLSGLPCIFITAVNNLFETVSCICFTNKNNAVQNYKFGDGLEDYVFQLFFDVITI